jgi:hypothetical protein
MELSKLFGITLENSKPSDKQQMLLAKQEVADKWQQFQASTMTRERWSAAQGEVGKVGNRRQPTARQPYPSTTFTVSFTKQGQRDCEMREVNPFIIKQLPWSAKWMRPLVTTVKSRLC